MLKENISLSDLCRQFESVLLKRNYSQDSMYRYRKVLGELQLFVSTDIYSPEIGANFLTHKITEMGGFVNKGHHSKKQMYYIRLHRKVLATKVYLNRYIQ